MPLFVFIKALKRWNKSHLGFAVVLDFGMLECLGSVAEISQSYQLLYELDEGPGPGARLRIKTRDSVSVKM